MKYAARHHLLALLLGAAACADPTSVRNVEGVLFWAEPAHVAIENRRDEPIVYIAMDASYAASANWVPCAAPDCPSIPPGRVKRIAKQEILGAGESDHVIAFWWHVVQVSANEFRPDSIRAIRIRYQPHL